MVLLQQAQITQHPVAGCGRGYSKCSQAVPLLAGLAPFCSHERQGSCKPSSTRFINQKQQLGSFSKSACLQNSENLTFELLFVDLSLISSGGHGKLCMSLWLRLALASAVQGHVCYWSAAKVPVCHRDVTRAGCISNGGRVFAL